MKIKETFMRKRMAIVLFLYDVIGIQLATAMAILTRFEFQPSTVEPVFVDTLVHYAFLNTFCSLSVKLSNAICYNSFKIS